MRQILKQGQLNFRVFFHDFADSQRVPFYARFAGAILRLRFCGCGFAGAVLQVRFCRKNMTVCHRSARGRRVAI
jgi:hypothetical protein